MIYFGSFANDVGGNFFVFQIGIKSEPMISACFHQYSSILQHPYVTICKWIWKHSDINNQIRAVLRRVLTVWLSLACLFGISDVVSILTSFLPSVQLASCRATHPLRWFLLKKRLVVFVLSKTALPGIGIWSAPLDRENRFLKNEISNQIPMLHFLLYTDPLLAPHGASSCSQQNRFLLQSGTLKWISARAYISDLTLPSFRSIWFFQGLLGVSSKCWSPMSCALWRVLPNQLVANPGFYWLDLIRNTSVRIRLHRSQNYQPHYTQDQFAAAGERPFLSW